MKTIAVDIPPMGATRYDVRIGGGLLGELGAIARQAAGTSTTCAIVTDSNVCEKYLPKAKRALELAGFRVVEHVIPAGEEHKNMQTVTAMLDTFLKARVERATPVVALGGGVVGDLTGYVAASLLR